MTTPVSLGVRTGNATMKAKLYCLFIGLALIAGKTSAQTFTTLVHFPTSQAYPSGNLRVAPAASGSTKLYGTVSGPGYSSAVFFISTNGNFGEISGAPPIGHTLFDSLSPPVGGMDTA